MSDKSSNNNNRKRPHASVTYTMQGRTKAVPHFNANKSSSNNQQQQQDNKDDDDEEEELKPLMFLLSPF